MGQTDPALPLRIGSAKGREARESGLWVTQAIRFAVRAKPLFLALHSAVRGRISQWPKWRRPWTSGFGSGTSVWANMKPPFARTRLTETYYFA
jgi:hypothetical protein